WMALSEQEVRLFGKTFPREWTAQFQLRAVYALLKAETQHFERERSVVLELHPPESRSRAELCSPLLNELPAALLEKPKTASEPIRFRPVLLEHILPAQLPKEDSDWRCSQSRCWCESGANGAKLHCNWDSSTHTELKGSLGNLAAVPSKVTLGKQWGEKHLDLSRDEQPLRLTGKVGDQEDDIFSPEVCRQRSIELLRLLAAGWQIRLGDLLSTEPHPWSRDPVSSGQGDNNNNNHNHHNNNSTRQGADAANSGQGSAAAQFARARMAARNASATHAAARPYVDQFPPARGQRLPTDYPSCDRSGARNGTREEDGRSSSNYNNHNNHNSNLNNNHNNNNENLANKRYKTRVCHFWRTNRCTAGSGCFDAHSLAPFCFQHRLGKCRFQQGCKNIHFDEVDYKISLRGLFVCPSAVKLEWNSLEQEDFCQWCEEYLPPDSRVFACFKDCECGYAVCPQCATQDGIRDRRPGISTVQQVPRAAASSSSANSQRLSPAKVEEIRRYILGCGGSALSCSVAGAFGVKSAVLAEHFDFDPSAGNCMIHVSQMDRPQQRQQQQQQQQQEAASAWPGRTCASSSSSSSSLWAGAVGRGGTSSAASSSPYNKNKNNSNNSKSNNKNNNDNSNNRGQKRPASPSPAADRAIAQDGGQAGREEEERRMRKRKERFGT
ncbi:unnamed protein product, partial [Polarella glacialis]